METANNFVKGLNSDISPLNQPEGTYIDAHNIRIINDSSGTSLSINNIKGNKYIKSIPNTPTVQKITITGIGLSNITINGESANIDLVDGSNGDDLYTHLDTDVAYTKFSVEYDVYINETYILINPKYNTDQTSTFNTIITVSGSLTLDDNYIPSQTGLEVIGSTTLRDDIYLFTTNCKDKNPGGHNSKLPPDPSSVGQIWRFTYNKSTLVADNLVLIYNNYLDFSTYNPIPPSACLGRYENSSIQRLYWTDNFNVPRSINVKDPNVFAIDIDNIGTNPKTDVSVGLLQKVTATGNLEVGCYQMSYRLKDSGGKYTRYSPPSNMVFITIGDETLNTLGTNWVGYIGAIKDTIAGKAITWKIQQLDTDYERVEIIILKRESEEDIPEIFKILDEPISSDGTFEFIYSGNELTTPVTNDEFLISSSVVATCKTLDTKDNRLFLGNIKYGKKVYSEFDSRSYRFTNLEVSILDGSSGQVTLTGPTPDYDSIKKEHDSINSSPSTQKYNLSGNLGGNGKYISYEFGTIAIKADSTLPLGTSSPFRHTNPFNPFVDTEIDSLNVYYSDNITKQTYPIMATQSQPINEDIKFSYYSGLLKGYQHEETYRFGIVLYDKNGNPGFVEWIGDIEMPSVGDTCPAANRIYSDGTPQTTISDYRMSFVSAISGINECYVNQLHVIFNVDIPESVRKDISGYSIVRLERTDENKSIVACGMITQCESDGGTIFIPEMQAVGNGPHPTLNINGVNPMTPGNAHNAFVTFESPEFLLDEYVGFRSGDKLKFFQTLNVNAAQGSAETLVGGAGEPYTIKKFYDSISAVNVEHTINSTEVVAFGGSGFLGGWIFRNYSRTSPGGGLSDAIGCKTLLIYLNSTVDFGSLGLNETNGRKVLAYYKRTLTNQYGGNTFSVRSLNDYILCSHFRPVKDKTISDTFKVFGGDVFCNIYDNQKEIKNWGQTGRGEFVGGGGLYNDVSFTHFFPCTSKHNTELRHGDHVNRTLITDDGSGASAYESYEYNKVYSSENNVMSFFAQPFDFDEEEEFDNRVLASEIKFNGEKADSWGIFKANNYWDVEGSYGPINALITLRDKMYFYQDKAFGVLSINPRSIIVDQNGDTTQLGTGNILDAHNYVSNTIGCKHQWGIVKSSYKLFWFDINTKKFYAYSESIIPESDVKGLFSYFIQILTGKVNLIEKPIHEGIDGDAGIVSVYDYKYNQAIFTFKDGETNFTLAFDERMDCFTSFYDFTPKLYISDGIKIFSTDRNNLTDGNNLTKIHIHDEGEYCKFYDVIYKSKIKFAVNEAPIVTKTFDNLLWDSQSVKNGINQNNDTWNRLRVHNNYQNTDYQTLILNDNIKRKERTWQLFIPRNRVLYSSSNSPDILTDLSTSNKSFGDRIRDKFIIVDLEYDNLNNNLLSTNNIRTKFRQSAR